MKRPSFQFYPADWRGSRWVIYDPASPTLLPPRPACYAVYLDGALSYIGQTSDIRKRIYTHKINLARYSEGSSCVWGCFDEIIVKVRFGTRLGDWAMREHRLIHRLQPPLNCIGSTRKRSRA